MTEKKKTGKSSSVDADLIRDLAELLNETGLTEIEIEQQDLRVRVARGLAASTPIAPAPTAAAPAAPPPPAAAPATAPVSTELADHPGTVVSPMVGTAYLAPETGAPDAF